MDIHRLFPCKPPDAHDTQLSNDAIGASNLQLNPRCPFNSFLELSEARLKARDPAALSAGFINLSCRARATRRRASEMLTMLMLKLKLKLKLKELQHLRMRISVSVSVSAF